jgi:mRNA-degrading endonuclease RelE of RelBE toxin-antitoxin system
MSKSPPKFNLVITRSFFKDLKNLDRQDQVRIRRAISEIEAGPYKGRKLTSASLGQDRWRVGNYRIRYDISGGEVQLLRVLKR